MWLCRCTHSKVNFKGINTEVQKTMLNRSQVICPASSQIPGHLSCLFTDPRSSVLPFHRSQVTCPAFSQIPGHLSCLFTDPRSSVWPFHRPQVMSYPFSFGKLVMWLETGIGSKLPLTLFDVTHPALSKLVCSNNQVSTPTSERQRLSEWETA